MKKSVIICGAVSLLVAAAGALFALSESSRTKMISDVLKHNRTLTSKEKELLDMNHDGTVTTNELILAKLAAVLQGDRDSLPVFYSPVAAKQLGRTVYHEDTKTLWCSYSGTGIEFRFLGETCCFTLVGDSACTQGELISPRYALYVDGVLSEDSLLSEKERTITINGDAAEYHTVRLVKLSESAQSAFGIRDLCVYGAEGDQTTALTATEAAPHLIEFIGDSITCGYGVDGELQKDSFKTANENAEKAYAILTAKKLNADYSLVCFSGHGIISGYTGNGKLNKNQILTKYYTQLGHASARLESDRKIQDDEWDFSVQPDLIVINLGTNDASYTQSSASRQKSFAEGYTEFLKLIRSKNPDAPILCTLGIMGQTLCDAVDDAVASYTEQTGDSNICTMRFEQQDQADGYAVDWHPSAATHEKASDQLAAFIKDWLKW